MLRASVPLVVAAVLGACGGAAGDAAKQTPAAPAPAPAPAPSPTPTAAPVSSKPLPAEDHLETTKAVMVTVELDFGSTTPTIAQALSEIERRSEPAGGGGRTFAILDAYGERTPEGKLHLSMHVSTERPGRGALVWKRTGDVLWRAQIEGAPVDLASRKLGIFVPDKTGHDRNIDGSRGPTSILDAGVPELNVPVRDMWPDGQEREVTFIYSACGCPVKATVKRVGERTVRTSDRPVMFPDDPQVMAVITSLMKW